MNRHPPQPIELIRPDDLLNLRIETENLRFERDASTEGEIGEAAVWLVIDDVTRPALLRVLFPPQHIAEFAVFESDSTPGIEADTSGSDAAAMATNNKRIEDKAAQADADENKPLGTIDPKPLPAPGTEPFKARIAAASRLVFEVKAEQRIPYTVAGLLDWSQLTPVLHPIAEVADTAAARAAAPGISKPSADQTALELPYRLLISPDANARWAHRSQPFGSKGRYELWHTRLQQGGNEIDSERTAPLRALWSPDYRPGKKRNRQATASTKLGRSALSDDDRHQLVVLTSAFHGYETDRPKGFVTLSNAAFIGISGVRAGLTSSFFNFGPVAYVPTPFDASQLMLSPLGGWLKSRGAWTPPRTAPPFRPSRIQHASGIRDQLSSLIRANNDALRLRNLIEVGDIAVLEGEALQIKPKTEQLDLSEWVHIATQGRDHYVRIVYEGELWPFRHRAAMVKVTERKFVERDDRSVVACLVQRVFIVVREPEKAVKRHDSPLTKVHLTTLVTPNLAEPVLLLGTTRSFWVDVGDKTNKQKFQFHAVGTDHAGREVDFMIPLIFASISDTAIKANKEIIDDAYNGDDKRAADFHGAKVAFTPLDGSDNPVLATRSVFFSADSGQRPPLLESAEVVIPSVVDLLGKDQAIRIAYNDGGDKSYAQHGYDPANTTGVFAKLLDPLKLDFRADQAGGFATPNQTLTALSRKQGPLAGDIANAIKDTFVPANYFPSTPPGAPGLPSLFGTFGLDQLLVDGSLASQAPKIVSAREGDTLVTRLTWEPEIKETLSGGVATFKKLNFTNSNPRLVDKQLRIKGEIRTPASGAPTSLFTGTLGDFDISLLDSVTIHFTEFAFTSRNGEKPDIKVALNPVNPLEFTGDLEFVEDLRQAIPPGLFGDGASLEVTAAGIRAGFSIGLPPLEIGVFALKDVSLGAALSLPFLDGKPVLDFNISERANPFQLRVAFFAGGGFFHLQMDTQGMRQLEAALEFGAAFGLSIAVATGEVHAMAGIYFAITREDDGKNYCTLTGYMRLGGRLSVIGIIRLSVEFNLSFTYQEASGKAFGRATVTVMVEVLLVSVSVSLTVERAFGGANDPVFLQTYPEPETWHDYASAFA